MDIFSRLAYEVVHWIDCVPSGLLAFFPHAVVFLAIPFILCMVSGRFFGQHQFLMIVALIVGLFIAGTIPVPDISAMSPVGKAWAVALCVLMLWLLPVALARMLTHSSERQGSIILLLYIITAALYVMNFDPGGARLVWLEYP